MWDETKQGAERAFIGNGAGISVLGIFREAVAAKNLKVHLIAHSAEAVLMAHLLSASDNFGSLLKLAVSWLQRAPWPFTIPISPRVPGTTRLTLLPR